LSEEQENSLSSQKKFFEEEMERRGYTPAETPIYSDPGLTGTNLKRKEFEKMLTAAGIDIIKEKKIVNGVREEQIEYRLSDRDSKFQILLVKSTSRLARTTQIGEILDLLKKKGINVIFTSQGLSTDMSAEWVLELFSVLDKEESRNKSKSIRWGYEAAARQKGKIFVGGTPMFGYDYDPKTNTLTPNENAKHVKMMFDLYLQGYGTKRIAKKFNEIGLKNRKGKPYQPTTIRDFLSNEKYAGLSAGLKWTTEKLFQKKTTIKIRDDYKENLKPTDKITPIISEEIFWKVQELCEERSNGIRGIFQGCTTWAGRILCPECGKTYYHNSQNLKDENKQYLRDENGEIIKREWYSCASRKEIGKRACDNPNVQKYQLDSVLKQLTEQGVLHALLVDELILIEHIYTKMISDKMKELDIDKEALAANVLHEIQKLESEVDKIFSMQLNDKTGIVEKQLQTRLSRIAELKKQHSDLADANKKIREQITLIKQSYEEMVKKPLPVKKGDACTLEQLDNEIAYILIGKDKHKPKKPTFKFIFHTWYNQLESLKYVDLDLDTDSYIALGAVSLDENTLDNREELIPIDGTIHYVYDTDLESVPQ